MKNIINYGFSDKDYETALPTINKLNKKFIQAISGYACLLIALVFGISYFSQLIDQLKIVYFTFLLILFIFYNTFKLVKDKTKHIKFWIYCLLFLLYSFGVVISLMFPQEKATLFPFLVVFGPAVFIDNAKRLFIFQTFICVTYCVLVHIFKPKDIFYFDIFNCALTYIMSAIIHMLFASRTLANIVGDEKRKALLLDYEIAQKELKVKAETDFLSGLYNRFTFISLADNWLNKLKNNQQAVLCLMDIDFFKSINDTYGHIVGDEVIKSVGEILKRLLSKTDIIGRIGGDEFVFLLTNMTCNNYVTKVVEMIYAEFEKLSEQCGFTVEVSMGISVAPTCGRCFDELYQNADVSLYQAKNNGKNRYIIYK